MKQILCLASAAMMAVSASAQVTWNAKAGVGAAWCSVDDGSTNAHVVGKIGIGAEIPLSADFSLMPSLEIAIKGSNRDYKDKDSNINEKVNLAYLQIPVMGAYRFNLSERLNMTVKAGPYFAYALSGKAKEIDEEETWEFDIFDDEEMEGETANRVDIGAILGVDFELNRFVVGAEYEYGFTDIIKDNGIKNSAVYVTIGYKF